MAYMKLHLLITMFTCLFLNSCEKKSVPAGPQPQKLESVKMEIAGEVFDVELAYTEDTRMIGMMHRHSIPKNSGMLFIFSYPQYLTFHMENCHIDLDGIFMTASGRILNIENMRFPRSGPTDLYHSKLPAKYVLELPAGTTARLSLRHNDKITIPQEIRQIKAE